MLASSLSWTGDGDGSSSGDGMWDAAWTSEMARAGRAVVVQGGRFPLDDKCARGETGPKAPEIAEPGAARVLRPRMRIIHRHYGAWLHLASKKQPSRCVRHWRQGLHLAQ